MKTKLLKASLASTILIALIAYILTGCAFDMKDAGDMASGSIKSFSQSADLQGKYDEISAELDMLSAKASIEKSDSKLVEGNFKYSSEELKPEFQVSGSSIEIKNSGLGRDIIKPINHWSVKLTDKAPIDLGITAAASEGRFDLSGIMLKKLEMEANASTIKVYQDEPNACELSRLNLNADAGDYELNGLGNFNFKRIDIDSKASKLALDLRGEYRQDGDVRIKANASTLKLRLPENVGVRIRVEKSNISTIIIDSQDVVKSLDGSYESKNYDKAGIKLTIYLDLNVTTVNVM